MFVKEDVLKLEVPMDAVLLMDICDGSNKLSEGLLDLVDRELAMSQEIVV